MGGMKAYEKGNKYKLPDTAKMTLDDAFAYIAYLLKEQKLIEKLRKLRKRKTTGKQAL